MTLTLIDFYLILEFSNFFPNQTWS